MGVAFLVMFPVAYTDVNDVWKLPSRNQRLAVGAAGILTELTIAAWSTMAWVFLPDGHLRNAVFLLATTTWVTTLVINLSPFMRFDGYFLLSDGLEMVNLHARSFALARWRLREWLFALKEPRPEYFPKAREKLLILLAYAIWVYRLIVFGGVALMVYKLFPKPLGPFLAAIELVFILMPIVHELMAWKLRMSKIVTSSRSRKTMGIFFIGFVLLCLPLDRRINAQGILKPAQFYLVTAPGPSMISSLPIKDGQAVKMGESLLKLESEDVAYQQEQTTEKKESIEWQIAVGGVSQDLRSREQILHEQTDKLGAELEGLEQELNCYTPVAPFAGNFFFFNPDIHLGAWVQKNEKLGLLIDPHRWQIETYLSESDVKRVHAGDEGVFYSDTPGLVRLKVKVAMVDKDATRALQSPMLASTHGGEILVREKNRLIIPEKALYRVTLIPTSNYNVAQPRELRGNVLIEGEAKSIVGDFFVAMSALWVRESGF